MLRRLKQRISDMRTIKALCLGAERHANANGQPEPGPEHFVLAALDLPDGTARKAFQRVGADPDHFHAAITAQYGDALKNIGIEPTSLDAMSNNVLPFPANKGIYKAKPQVQVLMQSLADREHSFVSGSFSPLIGAHVVAVVAEFQQGVTPRSLKRMGIEPEMLVRAAQDEISTHTSV